MVGIIRWGARRATQANPQSSVVGDNGSMNMRPNAWPAWLASPFLLLVLAPFFWSLNWIIGRGVSTSIPPMAMTFYRWFFAVCILAPFAWRGVVREWPVIWRHRGVMLLLGVIGVGSHNALAYLGLKYTTATNGVILNSFIPVMIVALSWIILGQRLSRAQLFGVAISLCGVLAILSQGSLDVLASLQVNRGDLFVVLSMLLWSLYTVCLRWRPANLDLLTFLFVISCIGDAFLLPFYVAETALGYVMTFSWVNLAAIVSAALLSSVLAYVFWARGVAQVGASVAGLFVHLVPVFGIVLAELFLDERMQGFHVVGIALILGGIYITSRRAVRVSEAAE
jgi:drug/metabolite transporter (DMT)-like permease